MEERGFRMRIKRCARANLWPRKASRASSSKCALREAQGTHRTKPNEIHSFGGEASNAAHTGPKREHGREKDPLDAASMVK